MKDSKQNDLQYGKNYSSAQVLKLHQRHVDDAALWNAFRKGDNDAFTTILDRFTDVLYKYGCKILHDPETVKDNIQDLFVQLYNNRASLGEANAIKLYLFKALRRRLFRARSKERSQRNLLSSYMHDSGVLISESPEYELILEELSGVQKKTVKFFLSKLTVRQREAIFLRYYEDLDYDTVADIMEIRKQAVYNLVHEAIELLRNCIKR